MSETIKPIFSIYFEGEVPIISIQASRCKDFEPYKVDNGYSYSFRAQTERIEAVNPEFIARMNVSPEIIAKLDFGKGKKELELKFKEIKYSTTSYGLEKIIGYTLYSDTCYSELWNIRNYV